MTQCDPFAIDNVVLRIATMLTPQEAERNLAAVTKFISGVVIKARPAMQRIALINDLREGRRSPIYLGLEVEHRDPVLWRANQVAFENFLCMKFLGDAGYYGGNDGPDWAIDYAEFMTQDFWVRMHLCLQALCQFWGFSLSGTFFIFGMRTPFIVNQLPELRGGYMLPPEYIATHQNDPRRLPVSAEDPPVFRTIFWYYFEDCQMSPLTDWMAPEGNLNARGASFQYCDLQRADVLFLRDHEETWSGCPNGNPEVQAYKGNPRLGHADMSILQELSSDASDYVQLHRARVNVSSTFYPIWNKFLQSCFMLDLRVWPVGTLVNVDQTLMPIGAFFESIRAICCDRQLQDFAIEFHDSDLFFRGDSPVPMPFVRRLHICCTKSSPSMLRWRPKQSEVAKIKLMFPNLQSLLIQDIFDHDNLDVRPRLEHHANMQREFPNLELPFDSKAWRAAVTARPTNPEPSRFVLAGVDGEVRAVRFAGPGEMID
jgi:hypothetical protein